MIRKTIHSWTKSLMLSDRKMARHKDKIRSAAIGAMMLLSAFGLCSPAAHATRLPAELKAQIGTHMPQVKLFRLDGSLQTGAGDLFLPLLPPAGFKPTKQSVVDTAFPSEEKPDIIIFSNGWTFMRVIKEGTHRTLRLPKTLPEAAIKHIVSSKFPMDLLVPDSFVLPLSLKSVRGDVSMSIVDDLSIAKQATAAVEVAQAPVLSGDGVVIATSPSCGKLALLDGKTFKKIDEFPTEGTPCGITYFGGLVYVADQTKNRILQFDPTKRAFIGQIDLPTKCAPKGVAAFAQGKLLYVSESSTNHVAVLELPSGRLILRTKVPAGPGRLAVTPSGSHLLVLNSTAGILTMLNTANQRMVATIQIGPAPGFMTISKDSQFAYVASKGSNTVCVVDLIKKAVVQKLPTGTAPTGVALNSDQTKLFVANAKDNTIWVFDTKSYEKLEEVKLPIDVDFPGEIALMPDGERLLISSEATDTVGVLNTTTLKFDEQQILGFTSDEIRWFPTAAAAAAAKANQ
jgi:YVTN family beta-propeller protein